MTLFERVFTTLEKVDRGVRDAVGLVQRVRGKEPNRDEAPEIPNAAVKRPGSKDDPPPKPLGDPTIAVQVYGRATDPWTGRATLLLRDREISFQYVELDDKENERLAVRLETETKQQITPYVYVRGAFIGGFNALSEIERLGQLEEMVKPDAERARAGSHGVKIVVAPHGAEERPPGER